MFKRKSLWSLVVLFVIISLMFALTGCGGGKETTQKPADSTAPATEQQSAVSETDLTIAEAAKYLSSELAKTPTISPQDVYNKIVAGGDTNYQLVSLQKPEDYAAGHVKGAINIPYAQMAKKDSLAKLDKNKKIVLICYTGHTASYTSMFLNELGYEAYAMKFGMNGWSSNKAPMGKVLFFTKPADLPIDTSTNSAMKPAA
ncbi:MAG: rhodanese-like domain-containing protein [Eubacteriales bacterium]